MSDVDGLGGRFLDDGPVVLVESVHGRAALDRDPDVGDLGELDGVVHSPVDRLGEITAHLGRVDVKGRHELQVADVITAEFDVHQARYMIAGLGVLVIGDALDK